MGYFYSIGDICIRTIFKTTLLKLRYEEAQLNQQSFDNHHASCRAYKKFLANFMARQKEHARYIYTSLDVVDESLKNPAIKVSEKDREEIIHSCLMVAKSLSKGFVARTKNEPIMLKTLLEKVRSIFAEKVSRSTIELKFVCSEDLSFNGDPLFVELILITLIGQALYYSPKNEKIILSAKVQEGDLQLEIRDRGYAVVNKEKLIKKVFNHFIEDEAFHTLCQENGLIYECLKTNNGLNIIKLMMPIL